MDIRPRWSFLHSSTRYSIRLIYALTHWVLGWASATPIICAIQYSIPYQANVLTLSMSIQCRFGHSDHPCISISDTVSGWCMHSLTEYWVELQPLRLFLHFSTGYSIRLIYALTHRVLGWLRPLRLLLQSNIQFRIRIMYQLTHWVFNGYSAIPTIPAFQYRIEYEDLSAWILIFYCISA